MLSIESIPQQELAALSAEYTKAQLQTIDLKSIFSPGHPALMKAQA